MPVAALGPHQGHATLLQVALPGGGLRLLHHLHLPQQPDQLHAVQQKPEHQLPEARAAADAEAGRAGALRYYNSEVHRAASVLPEFARKTL